MNQTVTYMLTTKDNPYNPFVDFSLWYTFDVEHNYNSSEYLARIAKTSGQMSDQENNIERSRAIDEIIMNDFTNIYIKVSEDNFEQVLKKINERN